MAHVGNKKPAIKRVLSIARVLAVVPETLIGTVIGHEKPYLERFVGMSFENTPKNTPRTSVLTQSYEGITMTVRIPLFILLWLSLVGCTGLQSYGFGQPRPAAVAQHDRCQVAFLNSQGALSWINGSVDKPKGLGRPIASLERPGQVDIGDLLALGLPGAGPGVPPSISCYATAHYPDGTTQDGILSVTDPGVGQPLQVIWIDRTVVEKARIAYAADMERRRRESIAYSDKLQFCTFEWKVAVEAKALMSSGWSEQATTEHLVREHSYGPNGQVYRESEGAEATIRYVAAAISMPSDARNARRLPDYASREFLSSCQNKYIQ